ncbi:hypothetical protein [Alteribacter populi]|uniref:hypothetical protein n=1 Tax=Alteribacter populi TaxID=2011011 RepID=UPI000BBB25A6|nr:hypothetical protein [Alteribacter populi]
MGHNKLVIGLPLVVMIGLFAFGYFSILQADEVPNEQLDERTDLYLTLNEEENHGTVGWDWETMPSDGLVGDDYIEVILYDDDGEVIKADVQQIELQLLQGADSIYTSEEYAESEDGILLSFPNASEDNLTYGNRGMIQFSYSTDDHPVTHGEVRYLHTWTEHGGIDNLSLSQDRISFSSTDPDYWVILRSAVMEGRE